MKNALLFTLFIIISLLFSSCAVVGGIFKAGFWTGIIVLVFIVGVIIFVIRKMGSNNK